MIDKSEDVEFDYGKGEDEDDDDDEEEDWLKMVNKLITYQKKDKFILTRTLEKEELDAEEFLRGLEQSREQLIEMKKRIKDFEIDVKQMEKLEQTARRIRDEEIEEGREQRVKILKTKDGNEYHIL